MKILFATMELNGVVDSGKNKNKNQTRSKYKTSACLPHNGQSNGVRSKAFNCSAVRCLGLHVMDT